MPKQPPSSYRPSNYLSEDTIAALSTPVGGAISILRMSGPAALEIAQKMGGVDFEKLKPREISRVVLVDHEGKSIDDAMLVHYLSPRSYSGENLVEFFLHGSPFIASEVLSRLFSLGARPALPGEFSFRAVRNGKLNLSQAQAVADLISASNRGALDLALEKLEGSQARLIQSLAEELRTLATLSELGIDFADQDVEEVSLPRLKERAKSVQGALLRLEKSFDRGLKLQEGISVALIGRPNAGKSSFFNALLGEDRSIVTEIAGTTRDIVREKLTLRGKSTSVTFRMEDTAGIRSGSQDAVELIGIERSLKSANNSDLILFLVDITRLEETSERKETLQILSALSEGSLPTSRVIGILNKSDLVNLATGLKLKSELEKDSKIKFNLVSSKTQSGISEISEKMATWGESLVARDQGEVLLTQMDQVLSVREALRHLHSSHNAPEESLFAADIRHALVALAPVIGVTVPDDILGRIFSQFCIGK